MLASGNSASRSVTPLVTRRGSWVYTFCKSPSAIYLYAWWFFLFFAVFFFFLFAVLFFFFAVFYFPPRICSRFTYKPGNFFWASVSISLLGFVPTRGVFFLSYFPLRIFLFYFSLRILFPFPLLLYLYAWWFFFVLFLFSVHFYFTPRIFFVNYNFLIQWVSILFLS